MYFVPAYILILGGTIVLDYFLGIQIEKRGGAIRKYFFLVSLASNVGVLAFFKYANFIADNFNVFSRYSGVGYSLPYLSILLPIGLSFHTFQAMSYIIEVYRGNQKAERHFGIYALYVMFYPQLVAGPIERPQNLLHQFREKHDFNYERVTQGLKLMAWGLFLKVVVADRMALLVDRIYNDPYHHAGPALTLATLLFAIQIYCDFCGYSTIAVGAAKVMGFDLMQNFNRPYQATSIADFWRRWHISLSTWFKDYVYFPLGGNRTSQLRWAFNILIVFTLSGLWHGASWTFIIWGLLHGFYMIVGAWVQPLRLYVEEKVGLNYWPSFRLFLQNSVVVALVSFAWIFFRANSFEDAFYIVTHLGTGWNSVLQFPTLGKFARLFDLSKQTIILAAFAATVLVVAERIQPKQLFSNFTFPAYIRWTGYYLLVGAILFLGYWGGDQFIYFQF